MTSHEFHPSPVARHPVTVPLIARHPLPIAQLFPLISPIRGNQMVLYMHRNDIDTALSVLFMYNIHLFILKHAWR